MAVYTLIQQSQLDTPTDLTIVSETYQRTKAMLDKLEEQMLAYGRILDTLSSANEAGLLGTQMELEDMFNDKSNSHALQTFAYQTLRYIHTRISVYRSGAMDTLYHG